MGEEHSNQELQALDSSPLHTFDSQQIPGSSYSISLPSEPPDIINWFSSYVYESPALDTSDDFGGFGFREGVNVAKEENLGEFREIRNGDELVVGGEKITSNGFVKCKSRVGDDKHGNQYVSKGNYWVEESKNSLVLNDLPFKRISEQNLEEKTTQKHVVSRTKDVEKSSLNDEDFQGKLDSEFSREANLLLSKINKDSCMNYGKSPKNWLHKRNFIEGSPKAKAQNVDIISLERNLDSTVVNGVSMKKSTGGSNDKENEGKDFVENGFISTRKHRSTRANDENSLKRPNEVQLECLRGIGMVSSAGENDAIVRRKALSEKTNFQYSNALEIGGKWRCPQKSKPNFGPPLKQLRLERWVHRV